MPSPKAQHTKVFEYIVWDLLEKSTVKDVAYYCRLNWKTIKEIDKRRLKRRLPKFRYKDLRYLALDKIYLGKKMKYKTIVLNLEAKKIIKAYDGTTGEKYLNSWIERANINKIR